MNAPATGRAAGIVPTLRYRDLAAAIDWLCRAFGFEPHLIIPGAGGSVRYAQLTFDGGMVMLGPVEGSAFDQLMSQPAQTGGTETQICYLYVEDAASHYERARAAGAEIVLDLSDGPSNGRGYSCRDPEGHIWNFGTYDPWKRKSVSHIDDEAHPVPRTGCMKRMTFGSALLAAAIGSMLLVGWSYDSIEIAMAEIAPFAASEEPKQPRASEAGLASANRDTREQVAKERSGREAAERNTALIRDQLGQERKARLALERDTNDAHEQLARERAAREAAERSMADTRAQLAQAQAKVASNGEQDARKRLGEAEHALQGIREQLEAERLARQAAERSSREARENLARERSAKEAAEHAAKEAREHLARERSARRAARTSSAETFWSQQSSWWQ